MKKKCTEKQPDTVMSLSMLLHVILMQLRFPLTLVADCLRFPILSVAMYLVGMCVPNPSLVNSVNEKKLQGQSLLFCAALALHVAGFVW